MAKILIVEQNYKTSRFHHLITQIWARNKDKIFWKKEVNNALNFTTKFKKSYKTIVTIKITYNNYWLTFKKPNIWSVTWIIHMKRIILSFIKKVLTLITQLIFIQTDKAHRKIPKSFKITSQILRTWNTLQTSQIRKILRSWDKFYKTDSEIKTLSNHF